MKNTYKVHKNTCALLPAKQIEYGTTIIEHEGTKMEIATPFEIIKESCIKYWSDYDGRRNSVVQNLGFKQKTPIPLSIRHKLCFFPTHSPNHIDNCWINFGQIFRWSEIPMKKRTSTKQIEVIFKNGENITLGVSAHSFSNQFDRAFTLMVESGIIDTLQLTNNK